MLSILNYTREINCKVLCEARKLVIFHKVNVQFKSKMKLAIYKFF